jgi:Na+-driven multidrug efflux pump
MAKFYFKASLLFTFLVGTLYLLILITFKDQTINFFSDSGDSNSLTNGSFVLIVFTLYLSWFDVANSGLLRGLGI